MRKRWVVAGVVVAVVCATGVTVAMTSRNHKASAGPSTTDTATVQRGDLSDTLSQSGILTYRTGPDGAPYDVINQASGTYTKLPSSGDSVSCGDELYRVDDEPVLLLCGSTPAYRSLSQGDNGPDVAELNANLVHLHCASRAQLDPSSDSFSSQTASALTKLQARVGQAKTGSLKLGQAVFLPEPARIATLSIQPGAPARPGSKVLSATSETPEVHVALDPSQQDEVKVGDSARITLPDNTTVTGKVDRVGRVATAPPGQPTAAATTPVFISLDNPGQARRLDNAPVQVDITSRSIDNVLSVPVTAIVGTSGGGFAVDVVRTGGRREFVPVKLGLFDTAGGRVEVDGALHAGDRVVVPSS